VVREKMRFSSREGVEKMKMVYWILLDVEKENRGDRFKT
jgi:hypothetical protein